MSGTIELTAEQVLPHVPRYALQEYPMPDLDLMPIARQQLLAAGVPEDQVPALLERAAALIRGLAHLSALDPQLPEPALIWQPVEEASS